MDADTAFLNGTLEEDIYMGFPDRYPKQDKKSTGLKLVRSLYGLKQSPRVCVTARRARYDRYNLAKEQHVREPEVFVLSRTRKDILVVS